MDVQNINVISVVAGDAAVSCESKQSFTLRLVLEPACPDHAYLSFSSLTTLQQSDAQMPITPGEEMLHMEVIWVACKTPYAMYSFCAVSLSFPMQKDSM